MKIIKKQEYKNALTFIEDLVTNPNISIDVHNNHLKFKNNIELAQEDYKSLRINNMLPDKWREKYKEVVRNIMLEKFIGILFSSKVLPIVQEIYAINCISDTMFHDLLLFRLEKNEKMICAYIGEEYESGRIVKNKKDQLILQYTTRIFNEGPKGTTPSESTYSVGLVHPIEFLHSISREHYRAFTFQIEKEVKDEYKNITDMNLNETDSRVKSLIIEKINEIKSDKIVLKDKTKDYALVYKIIPNLDEKEKFSSIYINYCKNGKIEIVGPRRADLSQICIDANPTLYKKACESILNSINYDANMSDIYDSNNGYLAILKTIVSKIEEIREIILSKTKSSTSEKMRIRNMSKKVLRENTANLGQFKEEDFIKFFSGSDITVKRRIDITKYDMKNGVPTKANVYTINPSK